MNRRREFPFRVHVAAGRPRRRRKMEYVPVRSANIEERVRNEIPFRNRRTGGAWIR